MLSTATSFRSAQIKRAWRTRPRGLVWPESNIIVLQMLPDVTFYEISSPTQTVDRSGRFEFRLERSQGVDIYGRPQMHEQTICEGVVVQERYIGTTDTLTFQRLSP